MALLAGIRLAQAQSRPPPPSSEVLPGQQAKLGRIGPVIFGRTAPECAHLDSVNYLAPPEEVEGCEECLAMGMQWVHLRLCQTCGHIGCCDNSPGKHATGHYEDTGHPIIRSAESGEDWSWCYPDELMMRLSSGAGE